MSETISAIAGIATTIALIVAIIQLGYMNKQRKEVALRSAVKEAVEIAKLFQKNVCDDISRVLEVYTEIGLLQFMQIVPDNEELLFTEAEALSRFGADCFDKVNEYMKKITHAVLAKTALDNISYQIEPKIGQETEGKTEEIRKAFEERNNKAKFHDMRYNLTNTLEWVGMLVNTGAAEENVIYHSLHQLYLQYIRMIYFEIAGRNIQGKECDHYYQNIIRLYNTWVKKKNCETAKEDEFQREKQSVAEAAAKKRRAEKEKAQTHIPK